MQKKALIIVDYQQDFVNPKGNLYVKGAEQLQPKIVKLIREFKQEKNIIVATKDWHPIDHKSFSIWPVHCVKNTYGAELFNLPENDINKIINKGTEKNIESYSAFFDEENNSNNLSEYLTQEKIKEILIIGVALDVCVSATLVDAIKLGFHGSINLDYTVGIKNNIIF